MKSRFVLGFALILLQIFIQSSISQLQSWEEFLTYIDEDDNSTYAVNPNDTSTSSASGPKVAECSLTPEELAELEGYKDIVGRILDASIDGAFAGQAYKELGTFLDTFGSRMTGSEVLENSIDYMLTEMKKSNLTNVHEEVVDVPNWKRGEEVAKLLSPRPKSLAITTLGFSVPTPDEGITANAVVVSSFDELLKRQKEVQGSIVVYSTRGRGAFLQTMIGAVVASKFGAVAALSRTSTPFSLNTPHTGIQIYDSNTEKIPVAALSPEDGDLLSRLAAAGHPVRLYLKIGIVSSGKTKSRNIIGDLEGTEKPEEFVLVSGHIDSWDVGQGALDDGVGVMLTQGVVNLLQSLDLRPKRTIRSIYWTGEEMGLYGGRQFVDKHKEGINQYSAAMEADYGCLRAVGFIFSGDNKIGCVLREIMKLMSPKVDLRQLVQMDFMPTDVVGFTTNGIPTIVLHGDDGRYFWYHHTEADVLTAVDPKELDVCLGVWAATAYVIADMKENLPKHSFLNQKSN